MERERKTKKQPARPWYELARDITKTEQGAPPQLEEGTILSFDFETKEGMLRSEKDGEERFFCHEPRIAAIYFELRPGDRVSFYPSMYTNRSKGILNQRRALIYSIIDLSV